MPPSRQRDERGQTLVEMAVALPVLLIVLLAIFQFGIVFKNYIALTEAVRVGSRQASVSRQLPDPRGATIAAVRGATPDLGSDLQVAVTPGTPWAPGSDVTVTATYGYSLSIMGVAVATGRLSSSSTGRVE